VAAEAADALGARQAGAGTRLSWMVLAYTTGMPW